MVHQWLDEGRDVGPNLHDYESMFPAWNSNGFEWHADISDLICFRTQLLSVSSK
jgi:hypothetical protein